jgi:hypothetical protein
MTKPKEEKVKNKNTEQLRGEFIAIYDKNLKRYGPDWFTFDDENKKELWEFVDKALSQKEEEVRKEERQKLLPILMNGYEDTDDFVSKNYQISATPAGEYDDDSIEMAELYEQLKKELQSLTKK